MKNFVMKTNDLATACVYAGTVYSRVGFEIFFETENEAISRMNMSKTKPKDALVLDVPSESEIKELEFFATERQKRELELFYGVKIPTSESSKLPLASIPLNHILRKYNILLDEGFFYPKFTKSEYALVSKYNVFCQHPDYVEIAEAFCSGFGVQPRVFISSGDVLEDLKVLTSSWNIVNVINSGSGYCYVARSGYTNYDRIMEATISIIRPSKELDIRREIAWGTSIFIPYNADVPNIIETGKRWSIRSKCKYDHHEYIRRSFNGEFKE